MGRVYEALKRAAEANGASGKKRAEEEPTSAANGNGGARHSQQQEGTGAPKNGGHRRRDGDSPEHLWQRSPLFTKAPHDVAAHTPASTERTEQLPAGMALPGRGTSRVAGATLDAAGSARGGEFVARDVSPARVEPHLVAITQPRSPHAERYRSLRTRVLQAGERRRMQTFVVTSANIMEGKTLTSLNLAWLLAQTDGVRALLIDGDLRQPCAAEYLGLDEPVGLSEVLAGEKTLAETIVRLEPAGLHLLPGGGARDDVAELLSGPKFGAVLAEARRMFDYIIIDAPPLAIFTDAAVLINRADGALLVVRSKRTRYAALDRLLQPLARERIVGVVLNGADEQLDESSYYYKRRYYAQRETTVEIE